MSHRNISGLTYAARAVCPFPDHSRARGAKALGLRYERAIGWELPDDAEHNPWFSFHDANGRGHCSPDYMFLAQGTMVLIECKYTWVPEAHTQLSQLYAPVVERALGYPTIGIVVCRNLIPAMPKHLQVCSSLAQALAIAKGGGKAVWHNLATSLRPRKRPRAARHSIAFVEAMAAL